MSSYREQPFQQGADTQAILDIEKMRGIVTLHWRDIKSGFWEIAGFTLIALLIGLVLASRVPHTYRSTTTLLIQPDNTNVAPVQDIQAVEGPVVQFTMTKQEILKSRVLAGRVIDRLSLLEHPYFKPKQPAEGDNQPSRLEQLIDNLPSWLDPLKGWFKSTPTPKAPREHAINRLRAEVLKVEPVFYTYAVKLHATTPDPELSARIANATAAEFLAYNREQRGELSSEASGWLGERIVELKENLEASQQRLEAFYEKNKLLNVGGERGLLAEQYSANSERLREARRKAAELESIYRKVASADGDIEQLENISHIQSTDLVLISKRQYFDARERVSELASRYGDKHPKLIAARASLLDARRSYEQQIRETAGALKSEYEFARSAVQSMERVLGQSRTELSDLDQMQHKLQSLKEEVTLNRELYNTFTRRLREADLSGNLEKSSVQVVDEAVPAFNKYSPSYMRWALASALIGGFLGLAFVVIRVFLDDTISSVDSLSSLTGYSVLSTLPRLKKIEDDAHKVARVELDDPGSQYAESIRTLRTAVQLSDASKTQKRILIASSIPEEGKTCLAVNLALAFGGTAKTLLLDCDFRNPSCAEYMGITDQKAGIVELLTGRAGRDSAIQHFDAGNIDVLSCVQSPPNPSELIGSERFISLLSELSQEYERIVIDSPPSQVVSDALLLANHVDAVLFVTKADSTPKRIVLDAVRRLQQAQAPILGTVLSQVDMRKSDQYGMEYYSAYYGQQGTG